MDNESLEHMPAFVLSWAHLKLDRTAELKELIEYDTKYSPPAYRRTWEILIDENGPGAKAFIEELR